MAKCFNCNDYGMLGSCPVCGLESKQMTMVVEPESYAKYDFIPDSYKCSWDSSILVNDHLNYKEDGAFIKYVETLDKLVKTVQSGAMPKQSAMILSSVGMGKTHLAYYCMAIAAEQGFNIAPLIDNVEYRRINNLSVDVQLYKDYLRRNPQLPTIEELVNSDLQFMYIDPTAWKDAHRDIQSLVSKRDRHGKATIILSGHTINQMAYTDHYEKEFPNVLMSGNMSTQKQLRVVQMFLR